MFTGSFRSRGSCLCLYSLVNANGALSSPSRHSGEGRNPVVLIRHSRISGNDNHGDSHSTRQPGKPAMPTIPASLSWIPAFAGMTTGGRDSPIVIPPASCFTLDRFSTTAPSSFRRRPESSGLIKTFPQRWNDDQARYWRHPNHTQPRSIQRWYFFNSARANCGAWACFQAPAANLLASDRVG